MRFLARRQPVYNSLLATLLLVIALPLSAPGQEADAPSPAPAELAPGVVEQRLETVESDPGMDEALATELRQIYTQTLEQLKSAEAWQAKASQFEQFRASAPEQLRARQIELESPGVDAETDPAAPEGLSVPELEILVNEAESALAAAQVEVNNLEQESARRAERRREIPALQADARARLDAARAQLSAAPPATDAPELAEARKMLLQANLQLAEQELRALNEEMNSYDARGRLIAVKLDLATREIHRAKSVTDQLRDALAERRQEEAKQAEVEARDAMLKASNAPIEIRALAERLAAENAELTGAQTGPDGILQNINRANAEIKEVSETLAQLESDFNAIKKRVEARTSNALIGLLLQSHRRELPDARQIRRQIAQRQDAIAEIQLDQIEVEAARRELANITVLVQKHLERLPADMGETEREIIRELLRSYYETRRELLYDQTANFETYFDRLVDLDTLQGQLAEKTELLDNYINERVLWVRSGHRIGASEFRDAKAALVALTSKEQRNNVVEALLSDVRIHAIPAALALLSLVLLFLMRKHLRLQLRATAEQVQKRGNVQLRPTFHATLYTMLLSLGVPVLLGLVGWRLSASYASNVYSIAIGSGLLNTAVVLWSLDFAREVLKRNGLGVAHFDWAEKPCRSVYKTLLWIEILIFPLVLLFSILTALGESLWEESLGRLCFMITMALLTIATHRLLRRRGGALFDIIELSRGKSSLLMRRFGYLFGVATPVGLLIAAGLGFYYSALHIASQLHATLLAVFCLVLVVQLTLKWLVITRKILAREQAQKRLEALREASASDSEVTVEKEHEVDLARIDTQTMRLIRSAFVIGLATACYLIWSGDLPALNILDRVELGTTFQTIQQESTTNGAGEIHTEEVAVPITLRNLAYCLFIVVVTFIAVQNLPGLIEIILLQRLSLIAGERYAINTIVGYVIALIGATWALTTIGLNWSKVQWLVAAVGLGLGFGLQEIFANLVSGLIILLERPIRVGDTVTVGEISGTVSKIRIRATWITAFNRQELIVPNKEFVTSRLVNWTLSDQVLRIEARFRAAYGSEIALVRRLVLQVAQQHPLVLDDPEPVVYFTGFGENGLEFELRVHSPDLDSFLDIKNDMYTGIQNAFHANGIQIPVPQRDVHVRTVEPTADLHDERPME